PTTAIDRAPARPAAGPWRARGHLVICRPSAFQLPQEIGHLDGGQRRVGTLVPMLAAGTFRSLLHVVAGEHAEYHRQAGVAGCIGYAAGTFARHVVEMRRAAADDRAEGDHGVIVAALAEFAGSERYLEGAGDPHD